MTAKDMEEVWNRRDDRYARDYRRDINGATIDAVRWFRGREADSYDSDRLRLLARLWEPPPVVRR